MTCSGKYKVAGKVFFLSTQFSYSHELLKDYAANEIEDFSIVITTEDIDFERRKSKEEALLEGVTVVEYQDFYLESLAVLRKFSELMLEKDYILFHGSSLMLDDEGFVFTAKSGTGKSTHTSFWRETFLDRCKMINDDKPIIHVTDTPMIYGSPWDGKHHISNNITSSLDYISILNRGVENRVERIDKNLAFGMILQQTYRPADPAKMAKLLKLLDTLLSNVPVYNIWCNLDKGSAMVIYRGLKGN